MTPLQLIFLLVSGITLFSALMVVSSRKLMHAALWLVLALLGVAIIFATLQANFFAIVQILVYIGAIAILIIFSVMLTRRIMEDVGPQVNKGWWISALAAAGLFAGLVGLILAWGPFHTALAELPANAEGLVEFGKALVDPQGYVIPFEVASVLLLAALVGAIYVAADRKEKKS